MKNAIVRRVGRGVVVAATMGAALGTVAVGSAAGDVPSRDTTPGKITLCSEGGYGSYARFPERGGLSTVVVPSGDCLTVSLPGNGPEPVRFFVAHNDKFIGATTYDPRVGLKVSTVKGPDIRPS
jgi:hypothetical protein